MDELQGTDGGSLVVRGWGQDGPGTVESFMEVVVAHNCKLEDMTQFLLEGSLVLTFVLNITNGSSMLLVRDLQECAKKKHMQLDFHVVGASLAQSSTHKNVAIASVVSSLPITAKLVYDLDLTLSQHGCSVLGVEHRSDNKKENNLEYNKFEITFGCPAGVKLSTVLLGGSSSAGETSVQGIQQAASSNGAELTCRWWDAMDRLRGKGLVVFGLSHVLCPYDVLDEVLVECGVNVAAIPKAETEITNLNKTKVAMLKGHSSKALQKVIHRLEFTDGARLVCNTLKRLGFQLAVLTNTGVGAIAEHVKRELGIDYAICRDLEINDDGCFTGEYIGEVSDVTFRKSDILKLMAERERISFSNVVVVGEFLKGLKASNARLVLETFGPNVYFNSNTNKDMAIVLYLMGFHGSDLQTLRKRSWKDMSNPGGAVAPQMPEKTYTLQLSSKTREAGQLSSIFKPFVESDACVRTIRMRALQDGSMCLGVDLFGFGSMDQLTKEVLFVCGNKQFQIMEIGERKLSFSIPAPPQEALWQHYSSGRHVVTIVQQPHISGASLLDLFSCLAQHNANVIKMDRLSVQEFAAIQLTVNLPEEVEVKKFASRLGDISKTHGADIAFQRDNLERSMRRMVVFDMDSTLIQQEVIDELGKLAGVEHEISEITEAAMRGDIDFFGSLKRRVALLKGHNAEKLFDTVKANLIYTPGAKKLCTALKRLGFKLAVISGGFLPVAQEVQRHLGLDYAFANTLEVDEQTGLLTGLTSGPVVTPQRKRTLLATIANVEGCEVQQTIAVGDGSNDIPMLNTAGLGIAFCAKPKVQAATEFRINQKDLSTVLFLIGVSGHAAERLVEDETAN